MKNATVALLTLLVLTLTACAGTPREQYEQAEVVYSTTLRGIMLASAAGELDADDLAAIEPFRAAMRAALDEAASIIAQGEELTYANVRVFDAAINAWLEAWLARQALKEQEASAEQEVQGGN